MSNVKRAGWRFAVVVVIGVMAVFALEQSSDADEFQVTNTKEFRRALENAANNADDDTITLVAGTYKPSDDGAGRFEFVDKEARKLTIKAKDGYEAKDVTLDGEKQVRALTVSMSHKDAQVEIAGISIVNGNGSSGAGGGIYSSNQLTLKNCIVKGNNDEGNYGGGGVYAASTLTMMDCIVTENSSSQSGGGIYVIDGVVISNSSVFKNKANEKGGGIYVKQNNMIISNSTIFSNKAQSGGGISCYNMSIKNSTIYENSAEDSGAGIYMSSYDYYNMSMIVNSIISKNVIIRNNSQGLGSGIYSQQIY
jgi:predicted outer membrane repeat protein